MCTDNVGEVEVLDREMGMIELFQVCKGSIERIRVDPSKVRHFTRMTPRMRYRGHAVYKTRWGAVRRLRQDQSYYH